MNCPSPAKSRFRIETPRDAALVRRLSIYGTAVELTVHVAELAASVDHLFGEFAVTPGAGGARLLRGSVQVYDQRKVLDRVSPGARRILLASTPAAGMQLDPPEVYQEGERFWIVDERWGLAEIDLLRGRWTSWILPSVLLAPRRCVEAAIHWPLAQLLRGRAMHLLPVASVSRGGIGAMILAPFSAAPELSALVRSGFRLIGQRWTLVRDASIASRSGEPARRAIEMCHLPGWIDVPDPRPLHDLRTGGGGFVDLALEHCGSTRARAACNTVVVVEPARRQMAHLRRISTRAESLQILRRNWPLAEMHPTRTSGHIAAAVAQQCGVYEAALSRDPNDFAELLGALSPAARPAVTVTLHVPAGAANTPSAYVSQIA